MRPSTSRNNIVASAAASLGIWRSNTGHVPRTLLSVGAITLLAGGVIAPSAGAARAGQTVTVTVKSTTIDNKAPGCCVAGTMFKGNRFKIDRATRIAHGSAKGLWYHGTATITGENTTPFKRIGWVKATAFA